MDVYKKKENICFEKDDFPVKSGFYQGRTSIDHSPFFHHYEIELQLFISGRGRYFIKNKAYKFSKNTVLIIHRNEIHRCLPHPDSYVKRYNLVFGKSIARKRPVAGRLIEALHGVYSVSLDNINATEWQHLLEEISEECSIKNEFWREIVLDDIQKMLIILLRNKKGTKKPPKPENPLINKIIEYLENNYLNSINLEELAKCFGLSPFHLSRSFKKYTGFGFKEYLLQLKVAEAKNLLVNSPEMKVASVAYSVGFGEISSFNKHFKKMTAYTPSSYRRLFVEGKKHVEQKPM